MKKLEIRKALEQMDKKVYFTSLAIVVLMVLTLIFIPNTVKIAIESTFNFCINHFGWMYILVSVFCFGLFFLSLFWKIWQHKIWKP